MDRAFFVSVQGYLAQSACRAAGFACSWDLHTPLSNFLWAEFCPATQFHRYRHAQRTPKNIRGLPNACLNKHSQSASGPAHAKKALPAAIHHRPPDNKSSQVPGATVERRTTEDLFLLLDTPARSTHSPELLFGECFPRQRQSMHREILRRRSIDERPILCAAML